MVLPQVRFIAYAVVAWVVVTFVASAFFARDPLDIALVPSAGSACDREYRRGPLPVVLPLLPSLPPAAAVASVNATLVNAAASHEELVFWIFVETPAQQAPLYALLECQFPGVEFNVELFDRTRVAELYSAVTGGVAPKEFLAAPLDHLPLFLFNLLPEHTPLAVVLDSRSLVLANIADLWSAVRGTSRSLVSATKMRGKQNLGKHVYSEDGVKLARQFSSSRSVFSTSLQLVSLCMWTPSIGNTVITKFASIYERHRESPLWTDGEPYHRAFSLAFGGLIKTLEHSWAIDLDRDVTDQMLRAAEDPDLFSTARAVKLTSASMWDPDSPWAPIWQHYAPAEHYDILPASCRSSEPEDEPLLTAVVRIPSQTLYRGSRDDMVRMTGPLRRWKLVKAVYLLFDQAEHSDQEDVGMAPLYVRGLDKHRVAKREHTKAILFVHGTELYSIDSYRFALDVWLQVPNLNVALTNLPRSQTSLGDVDMSRPHLWADAVITSRATLSQPSTEGTPAARCRSVKGCDELTELLYTHSEPPVLVSGRRPPVAVGDFRRSVGTQVSYERRRNAAKTMFAGIADPFIAEGALPLIVTAPRFGAPDRASSSSSSSSSSSPSLADQFVVELLDQTRLGTNQLMLTQERAAHQFALTTMTETGEFPDKYETAYRRMLYGAVDVLRRRDLASVLSATPVETGERVLVFNIRESAPLSVLDSNKAHVTAVTLLDSVANEAGEAYPGMDIRVLDLFDPGLVAAELSPRRELLQFDRVIVMDPMSLALRRQHFLVMIRTLEQLMLPGGHAYLVLETSLSNLPAAVLADRTAVRDYSKTTKPVHPQLRLRGTHWLPNDGWREEKSKQFLVSVWRQNVKTSLRRVPSLDECMARVSLFDVHSPDNFELVSSKPAVTNDITLITQLSLDRLHMLERQCERWPGTISASVYIKQGTPVAEARAEAEAVWKRLESKGRARLNLWFVFATDDGPYPVNSLRNVAVERATTDLVFLVDVDFIPSSGFFDGKKWLQQIHQAAMKDLIAWIVPAFEVSVAEPDHVIPETKKALLADGDIQQFKRRTFQRGHRPTQYKKWAGATSPYDVTYEDEYEPYLIVARAAVPRFDERFRGFGKNKIGQIINIFFLGFNFRVLPDRFLVHAFHEKSDDRLVFEDPTDIHRECMDVLFEKSLQELEERMVRPSLADVHDAMRAQPGGQGLKELLALHGL